MKRTLLPFVLLALLSNDPARAQGFNAGQAIHRQIQIQLMFRRMATEAQERAATQTAKTYIATLPPEKKAALKKKKIRYLAVPTVRSKDTSPKAKEVVMIWDIPRETLANSNVYEQETTPATGKLASFDNMEAEYIGRGE